MFYSLNLVNFGEEISFLRKKNKITQQTISVQTGVHIDSIRRIENGLVLPKLDTLIILSEAYKIDLPKIFLKHCSHESLMNIYNNVDSILLNPSATKIIEFCTQSIEIVKLVLESPNLFSPVETEQLLYLLEGIRYSTDTSQLDMSNHFLLKGLKCTQSKISFENLTDFHFTEIELRLLYLIAANYMDIYNLKGSIKILMYILSLEHNNLSDKLKIKSFALLSYNFFLDNSYANSLEYANKGLYLARSIQSTYCVHSLLARKAVALKKLGLEGFETTMKLCLSILNFEEDFALIDHYLKISKEVYNIDLS